MAAPALNNMGPDALHAFAVGAKKDYFRCEHLLAACLLEIDRRRLFTSWGASSIAQYAETVLGLDRRTAREMLRMARALVALPRLADAYYGGDIVASKVREITRVAAPDTEAFWLQAAAARTTHDIELMVARCEKGGLPPDPGPDGEEPPARRMRMRLVFEASAYSVVCDAIDRIVKEAGRGLSREEAIEVMARAYLEGGGEAPRSGQGYRVVVHAEPAHHLAWVNTPQGVVVLDDAAFGQAMCDAEILDLRVDPGASATAEGLDAEDGCPTWDVGDGDHPRDVGDGCSSGDAEDGCPTGDVGDGEPTGDVGDGCPTRDVGDGCPTPDVGDGCPARVGGDGCPTRVGGDGCPTRVGGDGCPTRVGGDGCPTGDRSYTADGRSDALDPWSLLSRISQGRASREKAAHLKRSIPAATLRHVIARHQNRCAVPGCGRYRWNEIHHLKWRMHGGDHNKDNLLVTCKSHHHMLHSGQLFVSGSPREGLIWRDAHGRILQGSASP